MRKCLALLAALTLAAASLPAQEGLIDYDPRWLHPHHLTFRPGDDQECRINPPRMSWPYVPHVLTGRGSVPRHDFRLQLSRTGHFADPDFEIDTEYNFYNALPALDDARWFWRVGYGVGTDDEQWSAARSFRFAPDAVQWDRTIIRKAADLLGDVPHPRFGPPGGDWKAWREKLEGDSRTREWLDTVLRTARRIPRRGWWKDFPKTDRAGVRSPANRTEGPLHTRAKFPALRTEEAILFRQQSAPALPAEDGQEEVL